MNEFGWLEAGYLSDPTNPCSDPLYAEGNPECALPPAQGSGVWGGGGGWWGGSGPLSGDYGANLPPMSGSGGTPCDFGACGSGFQSGAEAAAMPWVIHVTSYWWPWLVRGATALAPLVGVLELAIMQQGDGPPPGYMAAQRGKGHVGDSGVEQQAHDLMRLNPGLKICDALEMLMVAAKGNPALQQKIKATQKEYNCRRHS
ncbi:MAG: polymorphic toxin type 34 domain-containing protein [Terriglobia bacterium]